MDYRARVLPVEEWGRLAHTELGPVVEAGALDPVWSRVVVVEDSEGRIVGTWSFYYALHADGVWVDPARRGRAGVARRLLDAGLALAEALGARSVVTGALNPQVERLLTKHLGATPLPGQSFTFGVGG